MVGYDPFRPAWWLPGPHLQTLWSAFMRHDPGLPYRREVLASPDGDEIVVDHLDGPPGAPLAILLHGLEGSSRSVIIQSMAASLSRHGWRVAAINSRGCARDPAAPGRTIPNRQPRLYHSGHTDDLDLVVRTLRAREPSILLAAAGISLGGNVLLKWLGERPEENRLEAAAAISAPMDLQRGVENLSDWIGHVYAENYLRTLRPKVARIVDRFPAAAAAVDLDRVLRSRGFLDYDDAATAPLHGFRDARDYYARSSSLPLLRHIRVPTLCINAEDDPFVPSDVLDLAREVASGCVELVRTRRGGHVAFVAGRWPWRASYWAEESVVRWLLDRPGADSRRPAPGQSTA